MAGAYFRDTFIYFCSTFILEPQIKCDTNNFMKIIWDEPKRQTNLTKHRLDFAELNVEFFEQATIYPAKLGRSIAVGELDGQMIVAVVFKPVGSEALSVISMRPASTKERNL